MGDGQTTLARLVRRHARHTPHDLAFIEPNRQIDWARYDELSDCLARRFLNEGLARGDRIGVYLPDGIDLHVALLAAEKAGLIALGIGSRAGLREVRHLLSVAQASALLSFPVHRDIDMVAATDELRGHLPGLRHWVLETDFVRQARLEEAPLPEGGFPGSNEIFLLNSTSGTTGMPKCVVHDQARWFAFHEEAVRAAALTRNDVFLGAAPPPFGFGIWTTHVTPTVLGTPTVILPRFDAEETLGLIEQHQVTVLAAVSTQFVMMLNSPRLRETRFDSLRVMFTGGEMVPYQRALDFEHLTGAAVLQFYGSNETGAFSRTTLDDPQHLRLTTAGRLIESMRVRLFDDLGTDVTAGGEGQPGGSGPLLSRGYYNDEAANAGLYHPDGSMLMEDIVSIDADGYLRVKGRKGDFVIRGGKNISCAAVEQAAAAHPDIALAAAVGVPDPVLGERVMLFAVTRSGTALQLADLKAFLERRQVSRELFPEYLETCETLPRSSGGKIAKAILRERARSITPSSSVHDIQSAAGSGLRNGST